VISCADRWRTTSPIADASAAHSAINAAKSAFDMPDLLAEG
jgi:hypothetical protein